MNDFARKLRKNLTDAERHLWYKLRNRQFLGLKFRRQFPIGRYTVDFVCLDERLILEIDGGQHDEQQAYDQQRSRYLESQGFTVLRYWNHDVLKDIYGVLDDIAQHME